MTAKAELGESSSRNPATDLFRRFGGVVRCRDAGLIHGVSGGDVELGLSLGGCFWADPEKNQPVRASSISDLSIHDDVGILQPIARTCSLPMESEEEHRKRKVLQSLKRLEVKRQRMEKWESRIGAKHDTNHMAVDGLSRLRSQSVGSQGSSDLSDFDCRLEHGSSNCKDVKIPPSSRCKDVKIPPSSIPLVLIQANPIRSIEEDKQSKKKLEIENKAKELERRGMEEMPPKQSKERLGIADKAKELERSRMEEMPCVSARGNGPNGRMIQGLLYKYGNGVDVRIVCVCHGSFLTPTEFVKHAGGGDVAHPLRHIVISPPPFAF